MKAPDLYDLRKAEKAGLVRVQSSGTGLLIWNYTEECAWNGAWDATTLQCRGLITTEDGDVVARPFMKFFNYGEPACPVTDLVKVPGHLEITDKLDGSLGIIYRDTDGVLKVATRGSFTSDQALHATEVLQLRYRRWSPPDGVTVLVEIIYPENRIVLDYKGLDDLVYLGAVMHSTGADYTDELVAWPGPMRDIYELSINDLLAETELGLMSDNREGFVLAWPRADGPALRAKVKYAEYVALHRVVTGLSTKVVWEALRDGTYDDLISVIPADWRALAQTCADDLVLEFSAVMAEVRKLTEAVQILGDRKTQAAFLLGDHKAFASLVFAVLDGKDISNAVWRRIEPAYRPLTNG